MTKNKSKVKNILGVFGIIFVIILSLHIGRKSADILDIKKLINRTFLPRNTDDWGKYLFDQTSNYCNKNVPYKNKPEFSRSISLIDQRMQNFSKQHDKYNVDLGIYPLGVVMKNKNCLDIQYASSTAEMLGADGLFIFSSKYSNKDRLVILVSPEYKIQDDLMTALLLSHELQHAEGFIYTDVINTELERCIDKLGSSFCTIVDNFEDSLPDCFEMETQAFSTQYLFFTVLKPTEASSIASRYIADYQSKHSLPIVQTMDVHNELMSTCNPSLVNDPWECINEYFENYVVESPFYQEQCVGISKANSILNDLNNLETSQQKRELWDKYVNERKIDSDTAKLLKYLIKRN